MSYFRSPEIREKLRLSHLGKHHTPEARRKMSIARKGKPKSEETRRKISLANKGKKRTEEQCKHLSLVRMGMLTGIKNPMFGRRGILSPHFGKHPSLEARKNMSLAQSGPNNPMFGRTGEKNPGFGKSRPDVSGKNCHLYVHGRGHEPYSPRFKGYWRREIRKRDNYTCQICGIKENGKRHAVHHINYDKNDCRPENLITLCASRKGYSDCHSKTNVNRSYWINYFAERQKSKMEIEEATA